MKEENKIIQLNKFINGESTSTDFLNKIEFNDSVEYYNYYLGTSMIEIDDQIIKKIVLDESEIKDI